MGIRSKAKIAAKLMAGAAAVAAGYGIKKLSQHKGLLKKVKSVAVKTERVLMAEIKRAAVKTKNEGKHVAKKAVKKAIKAAGRVKRKLSKKRR